MDLTPEYIRRRMGELHEETATLMELTSELREKHNKGQITQEEWASLLSGIGEQVLAIQQRTLRELVGEAEGLGPPRDIPKLDFCLQILLRELVCEREPLNHTQIDRRYLWAPYSGKSITPETGLVLNPSA